MKYSLPQISMKLVTPSDFHVSASLPRLGLQQGDEHDTLLPNRRSDLPTITDNFRNVIRQGDVTIWRLEDPQPGAGAVFLSPLQIGERHGIQIDDVVVDKPLHRQGLGSAMIQFVASLAQEQGKEFVGWECEQNKKARFMYQSIGATQRSEIPFRLPKQTILNAMQEPIRPARLDGVSYKTSSRFSLFRTMSHKIPGYDIDPEQTSFGLQIESLSFESVNEAHQSIVQTFRQYNENKDVNFADIVIPQNSAKHLVLVASFDAEQNTYSGNVAQLWELSGTAFADAARAGHTIRRTP